MKENAWKDTPRILRERRREFEKADLQCEQRHYLKLISKLNLSISSDDLEKLICSSEFNTKEQISDLVYRLTPYFNAPFSSSNLSSLSSHSYSSNENLSCTIIHHVSIARMRSEHCFLSHYVV